MKLLSIIVFVNNKIKYRTSDDNIFSFLFKNNIREGYEFTSQLANDKCKNGDITIIQENDYICSCYKATDMSIVIITDKQYPNTVTLNLIGAIEDSYQKNQLTDEIINEMFKKYNDQNNFDYLTKINMEIDQCHRILLDSIEKLLDRQQKIEELINKSNVLSDRSKDLFNKSKKLNSCCIII